MKSIVWYPVQAFADAGYAVPTTWDELIALSDQIVADGNGNPWCISIESQDADGWVATDWIEDILLRTAPPETYTQWFDHEIPFNDPEVLEAAELMTRSGSPPDYAYGGTTSSTRPGSVSPGPDVRRADRQCWMQKQAAWIRGFWGANRDASGLSQRRPRPCPGEDVGFFYFPPIDDEFGKPVLGGADMFVIFNDRPEVRATARVARHSRGAAGLDRGVASCLPTRTSRPTGTRAIRTNELAGMVAEASTFGFDASDLMPAEVGTGTFWTGWSTG